MSDKATSNSMPDDSLLDMQSILTDKVIIKKEYKSFQALLFATCAEVCQAAYFTINKPFIDDQEQDVQTILSSITSANQIRVRRVALTGKWWINDNGPLVGFVNKVPCALLPGDKGGYIQHNLATGERITINAETAKQLDWNAYYFYQSLPRKISSFRTVFGFCIKAIKKDLIKIISLQIFIGLLALVTPIITGFLFDTVVPNADYNLLMQFTVALGVNFIVLILFNFSQVIALLRLRFKVEIKLQSAIWDRLLRLPIKFFNQFSSGDLAFRVGTISDIQETLTSSVITSIIGGFMSIFSLVLMFYLDMRLAFAAVGLVLIIIIATVWTTILNLKMERKSYHYYGKLSGLVLEMLTGISKLRVANAESRAFSQWSNFFSKKNKADFKAETYLIRLDIFSAAIGVINTIVLFGLVYLRGKSLSFGDFIIFNAAFTQFFAATLSMADVITDNLEIIPLYERNKPILLAELENAEAYSNPGKLDGSIAIKHLTFRYEEDENPLFKDFSFYINPGEFVALVGPSGSGKSTLIRLLLGFEEPETGGVYYNNINLTTLDKAAVRDQLGVVLQNSNLIPGTIFDNIVGNSNTLERVDAWEIAEAVGIANLIRELPMGMDTMVIEGIATLSGGEAQRLMLARALAKRPRILFLDEATSALDNKTQDLVHKHLTSINATQVVVAHRLSTIVNADKICVVEDGAVVQQGTYEELMAQPGLFVELAKRQLA